MNSEVNVQKLDLKGFPPRGLRLIEASAGTGKTYSIAALYVRLVLGHGREDQEPLMPPDILVLTYTRAATQELRDRIRKRLTEVASAFRTGDAGDDEFIGDMLAAFPDSAAQLSCARRLQVAAEWMDEAAIHTIHAWCQTMLRQHAFDSGSLFDQEVDGEDRDLFQQVVNDYWRRFMYIEHQFADELVELAETPTALARQVGNLLKPNLELRIDGCLATGLAPSEALDAVVEWQRECESILEGLHEKWGEQRGSVIECLEDAVKQKYLKVPYSKWANCQAWIDALDAWENVSELPDILLNLRTDSIEGCLARKAEGVWSPDHPWFGEVAEALDRLPGKPRWTANVWPHAVDWIQARYEAEKRQRNRLDFDDLLIQLDCALVGANGERLRQRILESFPVALIDEFQDTDPIQFRIFERVYLPERENPKHGLFLIGDPKQAIYAFRGADIHTYLAARGETGASDRFTLPRNFRSTESLVNAVNHLFVCGEANPDGAFGFRSQQADQVPFLPVEAKGRKEEFVRDGQPHAPLKLWYQPPAEGSNWVSKTAYGDWMAQVAATEIVSLLRGGQGEAPSVGFRKETGGITPVRPSDMAVLVSNRYEADRVQKQLRQRGVDSVYLSERNSIFDQPEAIDLLALLEAVASPLDDYLVRSALATPSLCASLAELDVLNQDEARLEAQMQLFTRLNRLWREQGVLAMIRRILTVRQVPARLFRLGSGGERALTNLLHLAELMQIESEHQEGEQGLVHWLRNEVAATERSDNEEHVLRLESDADLVKVITIFKSKGLQYPLVFVPFPCSYKALSENESFLEYHEEGPEGRPLRIVELAGSAAAVDRAQREKLQEQLRLFYVAVTRAQHACWVGLAPLVCKPDGKSPGKEDRPQLDAFAPGHLLLGLMKDEERQAAADGRLPDMYELVQRLAAGDAGIDLDVTDEDSVRDEALAQVRLLEDPRPALNYTGDPREQWWIASYSALRHGQGMADAMNDPDSAVQSNLEEMSRDDDPGDELPDPKASEPAPGTIHAFPRGATPGNFLHLLLEWAGQQGFARVLDQPETLRKDIQVRLSRRGWERWTDTLVDWLRRQLEAPLRLGDAEARLVDLVPEDHQYKPELEFWFEASQVDVRQIDALVTEHTLGGRARARFEPNRLNGMLHGFIDLVFEHDGRWYVADYKSNWIGPTADYYTSERMIETIRSRRYDMQYVFYTLALHRLLKSRLQDGYDPETHLGGAAYLFLRGCDNPDTAGVFFERPHIAMIESLDRLFAGKEVAHVA